jgi:glycosyltransferase involved in cell wall biosynthesis
LPADLLSRRLQEVTIGLALYADGASTRRSSLAALLEHGLPIVALEGRYTDDRLRTSGALLFVSPDERVAVPQAVEALLADPARRHEMSAAAGRLFSQQLAWPIIAAAYRAVGEASR